MKHLDSSIIGKKFGKLTVIDIVGLNKHNQKIVKCKCDCGNIIEKPFYYISSGDTKSCGCIRKKKNNNTTHGLSKTRIYMIWCAMKKRCINKKDSGYKNYGKRGITVCDEWKNNFEKFYEWSMNNGYKENLTIDRINVDENYRPGNCRWTDRHFQNCNKRKYWNNKTGFSGITQKENKFISRISVFRKRIYLGIYNTLDEAVKERNKFIIENKLNEYKIQ